MNELLDLNKDKEIYKQCPRCRIIIEKSDGCNHMTCAHCDYQFCWLCLSEYTEHHFAAYNFKGCPGMMYCIYNTYNNYIYFYHSRACRKDRK